MPITTSNLILQTPRLILQLLESTDCNDLMSVFGDPLVMKFSVSGIKTLEQIKSFIALSQKNYKHIGMGQWAVILKETNQCIGVCGINPQLIDGVKEFEISYRLAHQYWGKGLATEAAVACRDIGIQQFHLNRLISIIEAKNRASIRVAEKTGMKHEKNAMFHDIPVLIYSISSEQTDK